MGINIIELFKDIYDSEINISISSFWDNGYWFQIGDNMNGFSWNMRFDGDDVESGFEYLIAEIKKKWPESAFTKKYS